MSYLPYALAGWLFMIGLYGIVTSRHLVHLVVCLSVMQSSTYVFFLAVGYREGASAPIFKDYPLGKPAVEAAAVMQKFANSKALMRKIARG